MWGWDPGDEWIYRYRGCIIFESNELGLLWGSRVISLHRKPMGARQLSKKAATEEVINPLLDTTFAE